MSRRREVDSLAERYVLGSPGCLAVVRLFVGIVLLMVGNFALSATVDEVEATRHAARGDGVLGVFTAHSRSCSRGECSWNGTFRASGDRRVIVDRTQLRGDDHRSVSAGDAVPALDVGSRDFVHMVGGTPEWDEAFGAGFAAILIGGMGAGLIAWVLWGVQRTRPARSARREMRGQGRSAVRDPVGRDRWGWSAWPGRSTVRTKMARSWGRTVAVAATLIPLGAVTPLLYAVWITGQERTTLVESIARSWSLVLMAVMVTVVIQTLRLVLVRPRMWVTEDEIVIWDGLLLWKVLRIPRTSVVEVRHDSEPGRWQEEEEAAHLTPFGAEVNLVLRTRDLVRLPARRLRWGNWFWVMLCSNGPGSRPTIPQRGRPVRSLWLRVKEPRRVATDLDRWLVDEETTPSPQLASVDHAYYGRLRTHHGVGSKRLKIKGRLAQPVLAEFATEGPGSLRVSLRRTEFGAGTPVITCRPDTPPATAVLDDRWVAEEVLTNRFLHVEAEGPWTITIGGPERSRSFARSATGYGAEVLTYKGPPGIAVLTCPGGEFHEVHLRGPDLAGLYGRRPVVSAGALGPKPGDGCSAPNRSTFAVPSGAVLQVRTDRAEWRIDVAPLEQADVGSLGHSRGEDGIPVPLTGHVRPFEGSIAGDRAAVVRYLGPPGRVLFRGGGGCGLVHLGATLVPLQTLVLPPRDQELELRSHRLLQITGGSGTWSMEEAHAGPVDAASGADRAR
ncbi:hypothetical protein ACQPZP_33655 [Spirillospora sp. CA-142024]|uniref:hypothetical protein n=1 Tax=Spirillospora sp. CA-142024 TaxID=3240036 RepID=UPI003D8AE6D1